MENFFKKILTHLKKFNQRKYILDPRKIISVPRKFISNPRENHPIFTHETHVEILQTHAI